MTGSIARPNSSATFSLDYEIVGRGCLVLGLLLVMICPLSPDPLAFAAGGLVPWIVIQIIKSPYMPAAIAYWLLWQWVQTFARLLVTVVDALPMSRSVYGASVEDAYWYMLAGILTLAIACKIVLGNIRPNSSAELTSHLSWRPIDLFIVYIGSYLLSLACSQAVRFLPALYQQIDAVAKFKLAAAFLLFVTVLTTKSGYRLLAITVVMEVIVGITGLLSEFRSVFIILATAALACRVRITSASVVAGVAWFGLLLGLALFWSGVKMDYREFATATANSMDEGQELTADFSDRLAFIGGRMGALDEVDWGLASYAMVTRLAYVDVFGAVISVKRFFGGDIDIRQWSDALSHVFQPRFLFPNKPTLNDTEVYLRLTRADPTEVMRDTTSISVGYMGENYADLMFPLMLGGIFVTGLIVAGATRYFMSVQLPWMVREGVVIAYIYAAGGTGVEVSLPKLLGATVMFLLVYGLLIRFAFPMGLQWLDRRAKLERKVQENIRLAATTTMSRSPRP